MIDFKHSIMTGGKGQWSSVSKLVDCLGYEIEDDRLKLYFDPSSWDVDLFGLIYTDPLFISLFQKILDDLDMNIKVAYSEMGLQGGDYVDFDIVKPNQITFNIV